MLTHLTTTAKYAVYYGKGRDQYEVRGRVAHESIFNINDGNYRCPSENLCHPCHPCSILLQARWGTPEDVGKAVAMLVRGDLSYSTCQVISVDGGMRVERL